MVDDSERSEPELVHPAVEPVEEGRSEPERTEDVRTSTTPDPSAGSRPAPAPGVDVARDSDGIEITTPTGRLRAVELEPGSDTWSIEFEGIVPRGRVGDLVVDLINPLVARKAS